MISPFTGSHPLSTKHALSLTTAQDLHQASNSSSKSTTSTNPRDLSAIAAGIQPLLLPAGIHSHRQLLVNKCISAPVGLAGQLYPARQGLIMLQLLS